MDPGTAIATGLILGLSSGGQCFWSCASVLGPFMVVTSDEPAPAIRTDGAPGARGPRPGRRWTTLGGSLRVLAWYNLGRLAAYLATATVVSLAARSGALLPPAVQASAQLLTAGLLAYALLRPATERRCWPSKDRSRSAAVIGLLQGLMPCPPFITAIALALGSPQLLGGLLLFVSLFVGTALFTLPLAFVEPLRRRRWLTLLVKGVGVLVCAYLVVASIWLLISPGR
jgi:sulfite exporter TauE/SafE